MARSFRVLRWVAAVTVGIAAAGGIVAGVTTGRASAQSTTTVAVIGDSIMDGHGLQTMSQAWPDIVAADNSWTLDNLSADGDGYVKKGNDGTTIDDQVTMAIELHPDVVILSASSNDLGESSSAVQTAIDSAVARLHASLPTAEIVAVTPIWNESSSPTRLVRFGDDMEAAVLAAGGYYLDIGNPLAGKPQDMQGGDVHPNPTGQQAIATAVETMLQREQLV
jgi:acyl-CoA thioesterase-1